MALRTGPSSEAELHPRVLVVTHLFPSHDREHRGPWVVEQVDALAGSVDVRVLCCSQTATNRAEVRPSGARVAFRSTRTPFGGGRAGLMASTVRYDRALAEHLRTNPGIELLHAHFGFPDAVIVRRHARRFGLPYVVTLHGDDAFKVLRRRDPVGYVVRRAVREADAVICVSKAIAGAVSGTLPRVEPVVIENGYDATLFRLSQRPRDLGLLFAGNLVPTKNVALLLRAYASVHGSIAMPLTIAGDGPLRSSLAALAGELGIDGDVRFLGALGRRDIADLMARAVALVLPSRSEAFGVVVAEALASGTPVVASRVGGVPEIMGSGDAGILVPPDDEDALASALESVARLRPDRARVAASSRARPWSVQVGHIAALYRRVVELRSTGRSPEKRSGPTAG